jgi:2-octaprenyl-6-methoxyphenol hydroxylase
MSTVTDIVIAGGGMAGLSLAVAIRDGLGSGGSGGGPSIRLHDPAFTHGRKTERRAYAIAAGTRRMLETLGVWQGIADSAQPITAMEITDSRTEDPVRPLFLSFAGDTGEGQPFAHMVEGEPLIAALLARAAALGVSLSAKPVTGFRNEGEMIAIEAGETVSARLLVAADGARSRLRDMAGIPFYGWRYDQSAIVVTVRHEREHEGKAVEHFLPGGPFATLPLRDADGRGTLSSIVWTERAADAERIIRREAADFDRLLETRFGLLWGETRSISKPVAYPLSLGLARTFRAERLALLGDAAHVIHPIAGQGLNLGLKDAAALAEAIVDNARLGLDAGSDAVLSAYERARRFDTAQMAVTTDVLNRLFSNDIAPLRMIRDFGLGVVERMPGLKRFFIGEAAGGGRGLPRLMRGEAL